MASQIISRENLMEIHKIACNNWKATLENYAKRTPFKTDIELTEDEVSAMYGAADSTQKSVLNKYFTFKRKGIMGKVTSYETACKTLGLPVRKRSAYDRLCIIIKALNEGWFPDFTNENQYKYWNYFRIVNGAVSYFASFYNNTAMDVPSALYLKDNELALYAAEIAYEEYKEFYLAK